MFLGAIFGISPSYSPLVPPGSQVRLYHAATDVHDDQAELQHLVVTKLAEAYGVPPEAIAFAWLIRHPAGIVPVTGTTRPERLKACLAARDVSLSREHWYELLTAARGRSVP